MGRPYVMGLAEVAKHLGISKTYARELSARKGFPEPTRLAMGIVWDGRDIERWAAAHPEVGRKARGEPGAG